MQKTKRLRPPKKRNIEDVPFYQFKYKRDELPLDPATSFVNKKLERYKKTKDPELRENYSLHSYPGFRLCDDRLFEGIEQTRIPER